MRDGVTNKEGGEAVERGIDGIRRLAGVYVELGMSSPRRVPLFDPKLDVRCIEGVCRNEIAVELCVVPDETESRWPLLALAGVR
jgi:hypothetical protein